MELEAACPPEDVNASLALEAFGQGYGVPGDTVTVFGVVAWQGRPG